MQSPVCWLLPFVDTSRARRGKRPRVRRPPGAGKRWNGGGTRQDIQGNDVGELSSALRENESGNFPGNFRNDAVRILGPQIDLHLIASVGDVFWKAQLIDRMQGLEIGRLVRAKNQSWNGHGAGSQLQNHREDQGTLGSLFLQIAPQVHANFFLDNAPIRFFLGIRIARRCGGSLRARHSGVRAHYRRA